MSYRELGDDIGDTRTDDVCGIPDSTDDKNKILILRAVYETNI